MVIFSFAASVLKMNERYETRNRFSGEFSAFGFSLHEGPLHKTIG